MPRQEIVDTKRYNEFQERILKAEADFKSASQHLRDYWWNLWEIYREKLWDSAFESADDWIGDLSTQDWGPSRSQFFARMKAIQHWYSLGIKGNEAKALLGDPRVALQGDLREWFDSKGRILPEVEKRLADEGTTPKEVVKRAAGLGPGEARKEIRRFVHKREIYVNPKMVSFDERSGRLLFNIRIENDHGTEGEWTIQATCTQVLPEKNKGDKQLPPEIAQWLLKQLGAM